MTLVEHLKTMPLDAAYRERRDRLKSIPADLVTVADVAEFLGIEPDALVRAMADPRSDVRGLH